MKDDDPEIATAQNPKILDRGVVVLEKIQKTFTDSILNNYTVLALHTLT